MEFNSNQYSLNRNIITPVQSYQNSQIYQSNINYESQSTFPNTGLSQSVNLLNNNFPTQPNKEDNEINVLSDYRNAHLDINQINSGVEYYNQPNHYISTNQNNTIVAPQKQVYTENIIKTSYTTSYTAPTKIPMKVLSTKYLPNKIIEDNQDINIKEFAKVFPIKDYHNNLNTVSNTQIIQQASKEYFSNNIIDTTPNNAISINNVNSINEITSIDNVNSIEGVTPITPITNISYATEEYKTTNYKTQTQEEFQTVNYGLVDTKTKEDRNMSGIPLRKDVDMEHNNNNEFNI